MPSTNPYSAVVGSQDNSDEPWYERAWDVANKPLIDFKREGATGIEAGVENLLSGLTSPLSVGMLVATAGGSLLENLGVDAAKMAAPEVLTALKTTGKLANAGFTAMQLKGIADASPAFVQAVKNGDTDKALEIGTEMAGSGVLATLGARKAYTDYIGDPVVGAQYTAKDGLIGRYQALLKEDNEQARNFNTEFKKTVPDAGTRDAIQFYAEAGGDAEKLSAWRDAVADSDEMKPALQRQTLSALDKAQALDDTALAQVGKLRDLYDPDFGEAVDHDLLTSDSRRENYVARARWQGETDAGDDIAQAKTNLGELNQPDHTQRRVFESTVDGLLNGYEPPKVGNRYVLDAADIAADYHRQIGKEIAKRTFVEDALKSRADDFRPMAVQSGSGSTVGDGGSLITNSNTIPDKAIGKVDAADFGENGLRTLVAKGVASEGADGKFRWDTSGYKNDIRSAHTNGYAYGGAPDVLVKGPVAFHPDIADTAKTILAPEASKIRALPGVDTLMKASSFAKHTLLGGSAFHWVQEGLRGVESGVNPFKLDSWDMTNPDHVRLVQAGGIQPGLESGSAAFTEGLKGDGLLSKVPVLGKLIDQSNQALFGSNGFIDRLKLTTALKFADRLKTAEPQLDGMSRLKLAGQMANARFGGLNYLAMGRSKELQDIMRLTLLAPDWLESQIRDTGFALAHPKVGAYDLARIAVYNFMAARVLNYMVSGNPHMETPFGVVSSDGKKEYTIRTMPADIWHAATDPMGFASNRLNPITVRTGIEAVTGRDKAGHKRSTAEQVKDLITNMTPIPLQGVADRIKGDVKPGTSPMDFLTSSAGITTRANFSPAEKLAMRLASDRAGTGAIPADQLERHHLVVQLEDRLRSGDKSAMGDIGLAVKQGQLAPRDAKNILAASQTTRLVSSIKSLPLANTLDVWDMATDAERKQMTPTILRKILSWRKGAASQTPSERNRMTLRLAKVVSEMK